MGKIVVCGTSHQKSPIEDLERVSSGGFRAEKTLGALASKPSVSECVTVSTCNRVEIYAVCKNSEQCFEEISEFLCEHNAQIRQNFIREKFYFLEEIEAVRHLYRVAAGMDSMVRGEPQILGQLKRAYEAAIEARTVGTVLNKLFQSSFSTVKKIKNETGVGSHTDSVSSVAVKLARNIFGDIGECSVMIAGTGEAASEAAGEMAKRGVKKITIAGGSSKRYTKLACSLGAKAAGIGEIGLHLIKTDITISAARSSNYILKPDDVRYAMKMRKNEPLCLIDIALPRNIDPKVRDIEGVFLYDMDDLKNIVDKNRAGLRKSFDEAEKIIKARSRKFALWKEGLKAFPVIVELKKQMGEMAKEETLKALAKLESLEKRGECDKAKRDEILRSLSRRITGKFLHNPLAALKREAANSSADRSGYVDTVRSLFRLSGEDPEQSTGNENQNR